MYREGEPNPRRNWAPPLPSQCIRAAPWLELLPEDDQGERDERGRDGWKEGGKEGGRAGHWDSETGSQNLLLNLRWVLEGALLSSVLTQHPSRVVSELTVWDVSGQVAKG